MWFHDVVNPAILKPPGFHPSCDVFLFFLFLNHKSSLMMLFEQCRKSLFRVYIHIDHIGGEQLA